MSEEQAVHLIEGPLRQSLPGRDVIAWRWIINGHEVVVEIAQTAYEIEEEALSDSVLDAKHTQGRSEVERMMDWDVPNPLVTLTTDDE